MPKITNCLWFDRQAEAAAELYVSLFPNSRILSVGRYPEGLPGDRAGEVMIVEFELDGRAFSGLNGGPEFTFDEAISFQIEVQDQDGAGPLLGRPDRRRREREPVRLAEGPLRRVVAGGSGAAGPDPVGRRQGGGRADDRGDDGHAAPGHRGAGGRGGGLDVRQQRLQPGHVRRQGALETQGLAGDRVDEAEDGGVQGLAGQAGLVQRRADRGGGGAGAIDRVAQAGCSLARPGARGSGGCGRSPAGRRRGRPGASPADRRCGRPCSG